MIETVSYQPTIANQVIMWLTEAQYMSLILIGYLAGNKRLNELSEAVHNQMVQVWAGRYFGLP